MEQNGAGYADQSTLPRALALPASAPRVAGVSVALGRLRASRACPPCGFRACVTVCLRCACARLVLMFVWEEQAGWGRRCGERCLELAHCCACVVSASVAAA